jgi:hypothetical protein
MKKIGIFIASWHKGFLIALAYQLKKSYGFEVTIIARDTHVADLAYKILPSNSNIDVLDYSNVIVEMDTEKAFKEAERIENTYNIKLSMLISEDRALGQGYLTNVQNIPDIKRASWPYKRKITYFINDFIKNEKVLNDLDIVIQKWPDKTVTTICKTKRINFYSFVPIKFGDRMFWSDDNFISGSKYIERIKKYSLDCKGKKIIKYESDNWNEKVNKSLRYSYSNVFKRALTLIKNDSKKFIRGSNKKDSYHYLGWLPCVFKGLLNYNYVKDNSVLPDDVLEYKIVLFNLHLEPEVALQGISPEFSNSMEAISWISKSLPVNYIIVVKEQIYSYGVRSKWYYRQLMKMPNVVLSDPYVHSWQWIKSSSIVATITGTLGQEAVNFEKPVISFGGHQIINYLPTVHHVSNYIETNQAIDKIINASTTKDNYKKSRIILSNAQVESSIDMPKYKYSAKHDTLDTSLAMEASSHIVKEYPEVFSSS